MIYDSEHVEEAELSGPGPCIHHGGIEVEDRDSYVAKIKASGGTIISEHSGSGEIPRTDGTLPKLSAPVATRKNWRRSLHDRRQTPYAHKNQSCGNLKITKALGLDIPTILLARGDEVMGIRAPNDRSGSMERPVRAFASPTSKVLAFKVGSSNQLERAR